MSHMFNDAILFNQPIGKWNTSNVKTIELMFSKARAFNQNINDWDTSKVTNMKWAFFEALAFNQPLDKWDTSKVKYMNIMFSWASSFNQPINSWDTSKVTNMSFMFNWATYFNQPLNDWNTKNVKDMDSMFYEAICFNQPLDKWNTSNVIDMCEMFHLASSFNQDISSWDVRNVEYVSGLFLWATKFYQDLSKWFFESYDPSSYTRMFDFFAMDEKRELYPTFIDKADWINRQLEKSEVIEDFQIIFKDPNYDLQKFFECSKTPNQAYNVKKDIEEKMKNIVGFTYQWNTYQPVGNKIKIWGNVLLLATQTPNNNKLYDENRSMNDWDWELMYNFLKNNKKIMLLFLKNGNSNAIIGVGDWTQK